MSTARMGLIIGLAVLAAAGACCGQEANGSRFYVSTVGNDAWSGTLAEPNADETDGPFATLQRARDEIRKHRPKGATVLVGGGAYFLADPLVFGPGDSGTKEHPFIYTAREGERPVISGGRVLLGWKKGDGPLWTVEIPNVREGKWYSRQLFVNGQRRTRARIPNEGFLRSDGPPRFSAEQRKAIEARNAEKKIRFERERAFGKFGFRYKEGDIGPWRNLDDAALHVMHAWTSAVHWIADIDETRRTVRFTGPSRFPSSYFERQMPYYVENVPEGLDAPGEWYLDRKTGILTYWPMQGEDMATAEAAVSVLQQIVRFDGNPKEDRFVEHLMFRGLSFQHADWGPMDRKGENDGLSSVHFLEGAVGGHGIRHCVFERCEIARIGGYGLYLLDGSAFNRVQQCEIHDMGGGGILIGSRWSPYETYSSTLPADDAPEDEIARHNVVDNCFIHGGGKVFFGVVGVFVAHSPHNTISHNEICDMPYTGVVVGRRLDYKYSHAHHNTVAFNHIHHLGNGVMSDMGGIYTEGLSPGTRLHHNLIHDVNRYRYGGWGLYCDQASSYIQLDHNICYNCMDGGYMQNVGQDNIIRNNIFAFSSEGVQVCDGWRKPTAPVDSMTIERNIIHTANGEVLGHHWSEQKDAFQFDYNLYWKPPNVELKFKDWAWDEWRAMGRDQHSLIADPLFVDPDRFDFRLRPGSPAEKIGFEPIDMSEVGLYGDPDWAARPKGLTFKPFVAMAPPGPDRVDDDFEDTPAGELADWATVMGEGRGASIRVTDEAAAPGGRQSLKFTDAPGLERSYWPWLAYRPKMSGVTVRLAFDLRVEEGAVINHEWRTGGQEYKVGPSLRIDRGAVSVGGKTLATLSPGQWVHVEIVAPVGNGNEGVFDLSLSTADGKAQRFSSLPFHSGKKFNELCWLGFICLADAKTAFYLDNLKLAPVDKN
ncbi:MAG: right-handed parallel beta-helix repeat-containing protein [Planctomycetota bacterium]